MGKGKLDELFETREIIETAAASHAAQRSDVHQILQMKYWMQMVESNITCNDAVGITTAHVEFHRQIISASGNDTLVALMDSLVDILRDMRYDSSNIPALLPEIISGHREIMAAIEAGDGQAARMAMKNHLDSVAGRVKDFWQTKMQENEEC